MDKEKRVYSGKDIISYILPPNINFDGTPEYYKEDWAPFIHYEPSEKTTRVRNSIIESGIVDKAFGKIFSNVYFKYNASVAIESLFNL